MNWISIDDELPPILKPVWFFFSGRYTELGFMESKNVYYCYRGCWRPEKETLELDPIGPGRLSHWMPVKCPKAPE